MKQSGGERQGWYLRVLALAAATLPAPAMAAGEPVPNRPPLQPAPFVRLELGSVRARGWLDNQLRLQTDGLTGHAEEVIPELGPENGWRGGDGESWEKGPYFLRGLVSLAYERNDPKLKKQAQVWIDWLLEHQQESGQIGPKGNNDWWPRMVITWTLRDYQEATSDPRVIPFLLKYARYMQQRLPQQPLQEWAKARAGDQIDTLYWLYNRTGEGFLLETADLLRSQANQWKPFFETLKGSAGDFRIEHGVNVSQAMKYPVVVYERTGAAADRAVFSKGWDRLQQTHGLTIGMWSGTEPLAGRSTTQGVEMCSIVEQMLSSEVALAALGEPKLGDDLEKIAFNLLPGGTTKEFKQFQYYTLPNVPVAKKGTPGNLPFRDDHGDDLMSGPHSGFHCCCYNLHMGWPKYVQHSWMGTGDGGLAAVAYAPTEVAVKVKGVPVSIVEETNYPFEDVIRFAVTTGSPVEFPLKLRIPGWTAGPRVAVNGQQVDGVKAGEFLTLTRTWKTGDKVVAEFPAEISQQQGYRGSASLWRGPLVFTLKVGEKATALSDTKSGFADLDMVATTQWNYALDLDREKPVDAVKMSRRRMPQNPWLPETTPITLTAPARKVPQWGLVRNGAMADEVPASPVSTAEPLEQITLVPFGAQTLRITAFPLLRGTAVLEPGITASHMNGEALEAVLTNSLPGSSKGEGIPRFTFWNHTGGEEWVQWSLGRKEKVSLVSVYWFDDTGSGRCRVPASWRISYRDGDAWKPVSNPSPSGVAVDQLNRVTFEPVETTELRLDIEMQNGFSAGILQLNRG